MTILDGKKYREELLSIYKEEIKKNNYEIKLSIILVGNKKDSLTYVNNKIKYCKEVGIDVNLYSLDEKVSEIEVLNLIDKLNKDKTVTGIILQSPVPKQIDFDKCASKISSKKDVDGFTTDNVFNLYQGKNTVLPCTVKGIIKLLEYYDVNLQGKNVCILGRSKIVGKPLALALLNKNATITVCHSYTENLSDITSKADILISAMGKSKLIKKEYVKENAIVVDVGINFEDGKLCGDVDFDNICEKCSFITKVPGGVGPMTIAMIIDNLIELKKGDINNG